MGTEQLTNIICNQIIKAEAARTEDLELLQYGMYQILTTLQQLGVLLIAGLMLRILPEITVFTVCYALLRKYIGGAHAKNHTSCLLIFTVVAIMMPILCIRCPPELVFALVIFLLHCMLILVYFKAPAIHPNSPRSEKSILHFRKMGIRMSFIEYALIMVGINAAPSSQKSLLLCGACGCWMAAITLVFPIPKPERGNCQKRKTAH